MEIEVWILDGDLEGDGVGSDVLSTSGARLILMKWERVRIEDSTHLQAASALGSCRGWQRQRDDGDKELHD